MRRMAKKRAAATAKLNKKEELESARKRTR